MANFFIFILEIPAGKEIKVLTTGNKREKKVIAEPYFLNQ